MRCAPWTTAEVAIVREHQRRSVLYIQCALREAGYPARTLSSIKTRRTMVRGDRRNGHTYEVCTDDNRNRAR